MNAPLYTTTGSSAAPATATASTRPAVFTARTVAEVLAGSQRDPLVVILAGSLTRDDLSTLDADDLRRSRVFAVTAP